jgi:5'-nucleotidase
MKNKTENFTILHSNDIHGSIKGKQVAEEVVGGFSYLSGYINKTRREVGKESVLYVISGDVLSGSFEDARFEGLATVELLNYIAPDAVSLGNHDFDYGVSRLLLLEKLANFPILNANIYISNSGKRILKPYQIINRKGYNILMIGLVTEEIENYLAKKENLKGIISCRNAEEEIPKIINQFSNVDVDLTILLTHVGIEKDREIAEKLDPNLGVDIIIGGHSHTTTAREEIVNGIIIVQAGSGNTEIGRLDVVVNDETNSVIDFNYKIVPLDKENSERDVVMENYMENRLKAIDDEGGEIIVRLPKSLSHETRIKETELGDFIADVFKNRLKVDIAFIGSGSIRKDLPKIVTRRALYETFPFRDGIKRYRVNGKTLKKLFENFMSKENIDNQDGEFFQVSGGMKAVYDRNKKSLIHLSLHSKPIEDNKTYTICMQNFQYHRCLELFNLKKSDFIEVKKGTITNQYDALEGYLYSLREKSIPINSKGGRLIYK